MGFPAGIQISRCLNNSFDFRLKGPIVNGYVLIIFSLEPIYEFIHKLSDTKLLYRLVSLFQQVLENLDTILLLQGYSLHVLHFHLCISTEILEQPNSPIFRSVGRYVGRTSLSFYQNILCLTYFDDTKNN